jgi:hypothetical protein
MRRWALQRVIAGLIEEALPAIRSAAALEGLSPYQASTLPPLVGLVEGQLREAQRCQLEAAREIDRLREAIVSPRVPRLPAQVWRERMATAVERDPDITVLAFVAQERGRTEPAGLEGAAQ